MNAIRRFLDRAGAKQPEVARSTGHAVVPPAPFTRWLDAAIEPKRNDYYEVTSYDRDNPVVRRTLFTDGRWVDSQPVRKWREAAARRPNAHVETLDRAVPPRRPIRAEELTLVPIDGAEVHRLTDERRALVALAKSALKVEVIRVYRVDPSKPANGTLSGPVVAKGQLELAQRVGADIVLHKIEDLSRQCEPGEKVTFDYVNGKAVVYDGLQFDVVVGGDAPSEVKAEFRRQMVRALAQVEDAASNDELVKAAVGFAVKRTCELLNVGTGRVPLGEVVVVDRIHRSFNKFEPTLVPMEPTARRPRAAAA